MTQFSCMFQIFFVLKKDTILQPTSSRRPDGSAPVMAAIIILVRVAPRWSMIVLITSRYLPPSHEFGMSMTSDRKDNIDLQASLLHKN